MYSPFMGMTPAEIKAFMQSLGYDPNVPGSYDAGAPPGVGIRGYAPPGLRWQYNPFPSGTGNPAPFRPPPIGPNGTSYIPGNGLPTTRPWSPPTGINIPGVPGLPPGYTPPLNLPGGLPTWQGSYPPITQRPYTGGRPTNNEIFGENPLPTVDEGPRFIDPMPGINKNPRWQPTLDPGQTGIWNLTPITPKGPPYRPLPIRPGFPGSSSPPPVIPPYVPSNRGAPPWGNQRIPNFPLDGGGTKRPPKWARPFIEGIPIGPETPFGRPRIHPGLIIPFLLPIPGSSPTPGGPPPPGSGDPGDGGPGGFSNIDPENGTQVAAASVEPQQTSAITQAEIEHGGMGNDTNHEIPMQMMDSQAMYG